MRKLIVLLSCALVVAAAVVVYPSLCSAAGDAQTDRLHAVRYRSVRVWGSAGMGQGQFEAPCGIAVDADGTVSVADSDNHRVEQFTNDGQFLTSWKLTAPPNGTPGIPMGIAAGRDGYLFVTDGANHCVDKFTRAGKLAMTWGTKGTANGQFQSPCGIALDPQGNVYVCDTNNHRLQAFTPNGAFIRKWDDRSNGGYANFIAIDRTGQVVVTYLNAIDGLGEMIRTFTSEGGYLKQWGAVGKNGDDLSTAVGVAVDALGNIYLADLGHHHIVKYDREGNFLTKWGSLGNNPGQLASPRGIAVDAHGVIYVTELANRRVQVFAPE